MNTYVSALCQSPLCTGMAPDEIAALWNDLRSHRRQYRRGEFIFFAGQEIRQLAVMLSGTVHLVQEDYWGNRNILAQIRSGAMFAEAFACLPHCRSTVDALAVDDVELIAIDAASILSGRTVPESVQVKAAANLLAILAERNVMLTEKIRYLSQRSTRQKLMFYLSDEAARQGSPSFVLPFNRQELADYLSVDRSAMSAELSRMKKEGLLEYEKNHFVLHALSSPHS